MSKKINYWLFKSEPDVFGINDLKNRPNKSEKWDGVRNYQARNFLRDEVKKGDLILFYHSSCPVPGVAGIAEVTHEASPDLTALDPKGQYFDPKATADNPRWYVVTVKWKETFKRVVELKEMREHKALSDMKLLQKGNRLSIMPIDKKHFDYIISLS